jgi:hypothetical protein
MRINTWSTKVSVPSSDLGSPSPSPGKECVTPLGPWGGQHLLADEGLEGPNSDDWTESLALCLLCENMVLMEADA